ncbi:MAG TPA: helix-turn-helix domain-containing protein, partial [Planctomycetes bacterium]|nr:helix-turn-helix domain-containing protein [Planctomycetota bacterium]
MEDGEEMWQVQRRQAQAPVLIVLNLAEGRSVADTARALKVNRRTVYRVAARFREGGEEGLIDGRVDNGDCKL